MGKNKATLIGLLAILLWSSIVGLVRGVSESFGPVGGAALIHTLASVFLAFSVGWPRVREFPGRYLFWGSLLFVAYELCLTATVLWIQYFFAGEAAMDFNARSSIYLVLAASAMGFGYAAWNVGILHGHIAILAGASYFIPVLSAALAAVLLSAPLSAQFWQGAAMVCIGSVLCWQATRPAKAKEKAG